ncbi:MAG: hypothetical protein J0H60_25385, partial [Rhizobiales bacterium]|nr:hypothetical protein [Hyphomicrobiales bacterium]
MKALFEPPERPEKGLTHSFIIGLRANPLGGHYDVADSGETTSLRIRVSQRAKKFYMSARWRKGATSATSRLLGEFWEGDDAPLPCFLTLAGARQKTREWEKLRRAGTDPRTANASEVTPPSPDDISSGEKDGITTSFAALAEEYLKSDGFQGKRSRQKSEGRILYYLLDPKRNPWMNRPASNISDTEIAQLVVAINQHSSSQARQVLQDIKQMYKYGTSARRPKPLRLTSNPTAGLKSKDLELKNVERQVILTDDEIVA